MNITPCVYDIDLEHYWAFPEFLRTGITYPAFPAVATTSYVGRSTARLYLANDVCIAHDRRAVGNVPGPGSEAKCSPLWVPAVASCLTMNALVNNSVDIWLVDTACGYDLVSKQQANRAKRWVKDSSYASDVPDREWSDDRGSSGENDYRGVQRGSCSLRTGIEASNAICFPDACTWDTRSHGRKVRIRMYCCQIGRCAH